MAEEPIVPEEKDIWVVFDGYGNQIFNTYDEIYANFDFMQLHQKSSVGFQPPCKPCLEDKCAKYKPGVW